MSTVIHVHVYLSFILSGERVKSIQLSHDYHMIHIMPHLHVINDANVSNTVHFKHIRSVPRPSNVTHI